MSNNKIQSTQKLMFAQNPNFVIQHNRPYHQPLVQQQTTMVNQPSDRIHHHPHVTIKPHIVINPRVQPLMTPVQTPVHPQRGCNC